MPLTYPNLVPSGVDIIPAISGSNNIGSADKPFNYIYANEIVDTSGSSIYVEKAGDTMTGTLNAPVLSGTTISGTNLSATNLTSDITLASGTDILNNVSGVNTLGSVANPFNGVYVDNVNAYQVVVSKFNEVPFGDIDSSNSTYTLAYAPYNNSLQLLKNGVYMIPSGIGIDYDYSLSGTTITTVTAPVSGASLVCNYTYLG